MRVSVKVSRIRLRGARNKYFRIRFRALSLPDVQLSGVNQLGDKAARSIESNTGGLRARYQNILWDCSFGRDEVVEVLLRLIVPALLRLLDLDRQLVVCGGIDPSQTASGVVTKIPNVLHVTILISPPNPAAALCSNELVHMLCVRRVDNKNCPCPIR